MESPEKIGMDRLSSIFMDDNSVNVAMNAPNTIVDVFRLWLNNSPIMQQVIKHATDPDKVFRPILRKG